MIDRQQLLKDLQRLLPKLEKDILAYCNQNAERSQHLQDEYKKAQEAGRTSEHFVEWQSAQITQAAVAWVLICVFIRFMEDNGLLAEPVLSGPVQRPGGSQPLKHAKDRIEAYFNQHPTHAEREYLLQLFAQLEQLPAVAELLDHRHNPLWQIPVSADGAKELIDFFQKINPETGHLIHDFTDPQWDTRFLGDLYQDLSEAVRKRYALLQTPEFVESFILDYTLEPAIDAFGLTELRLIDPTCGSGHFLLTTFERVFERWQKREPGTNRRELAQRALNVVHGTDINPYAIAICRFRLLIAAMKACDIAKIKDAPAFRFQLACGDSLLHGSRFEWQGQGIQQGLLDEDKKHVYEVEDPQKLNKILGQQYHVVVGNPPYITVKDKALNQAYRDKYPTCHMKYSLGVPFTERFFDLTLPAQGNQFAGYMGMITANSFMKREFGKKLIEEYFPRKDLTHVIDTSGAYIPGHGTPTVILLARNQQPRIEKVRAALGIRGEPGTPGDAAQGKVWRSIVELLPKPGSENEYISVVDQARSLFSSHPWSVGGGGASDLKQLLDTNSFSSLGELSDSIGFASFTGSDDVFVAPRHALERKGAPSTTIKEFIYGEAVRDWAINPDLSAFCPYDENHEELPIESFINSYREHWRYKNTLGSVVSFGNQTRKQLGDNWWGWYRWVKHKYDIPLSITFAEVASHNHFVLDRGGKVFKQTAPVIKLPADASEEQHFALLGLLNTSTACFWMKQVCHQKQMTGGDGVRVADRSKVPYQFAGTALKKMPIPEAFEEPEFRRVLIDLTAQADHLSMLIGAHSAEKTLQLALEKMLPLENLWNETLNKRAKLRGQLVLIQEELDWRLYYAYGICDLSLMADVSAWMDLDFDAGRRPFEILAGNNQDGFVVPKEVPCDWPKAMQDKWRQRMQAIQNNDSLRIIEDPHYKRRWIGRQGLFNQSAKTDEMKTACRDWLLDKLEHYCHDANLQTVAQLTDCIRNDKDFIRVAEFFIGSDNYDLQSLAADLVANDHVPQIAIARLKPEAMGKFRAWQETWAKQRIEDAIDVEFGVDVPLSSEDAQIPEKKEAYKLSQQDAAKKKNELVGNIPVPPEYKPTDFRKPSYASLRGKLDVPKERFFSLPGCEKDGDTTLVIGWAGLNPLQRAQAIAAWYEARKENDGWEAHRLMPMLVALDELIPWLKQWHNDIDPEFGERMGNFYEGYLFEELRRWELTREELNQWQPAATTSRKARAPRKVKAGAAE